MQNLPQGLLEQLIGEMSTLASVYHKPPETFVGKGRFGADAVQKRAIEEQLQNARENPIRATGKPMENLLDIDFDGAAPASAATHTPPAGGLEDLMGDLAGTSTPPPLSAIATAGSNLEDLLGLASPISPTSGNSVLNGFEGLNLSSTSTPQPPAPQQEVQEQKKTNEDILGLF